MISKINIKGHGDFKVIKDLMHRGKNPRLILLSEGRFKQVQFNSFSEYSIPRYQLGYDYNGNEIQIMVLNN